MNKGLKITLWSFLILFFLIGLFVPEETPTQENKTPGESRFIIKYDSTKNADYKQYESVLKESKLFDIATEELNRSLKLSGDVTVIFKECNEANAFYDPTKRAIVMCYELFDEIAETFSEDATMKEELGTWTLQTMLFIFYHELGHALIHQFDIPFTGKEEDTVDQFSTIILTEMGEEGETATLNGAYFFFIRGQNTDLEDLAFWDEHSLDEQRFYNIACLVYGKNPEAHNYLIEDEWLPKERAARCEQEYKQISSSWNRLLEPHLK